MLGLNLEQTTLELCQRFAERPLLALDVGGSCGELTARLAEAGYAAFCLDRERYTRKVEGLSARRMIVRAAEDMFGVPDNTFHLITSTNALNCTDVERAVNEIYRVLKPGGEAFLDLDCCAYPDSESECLKAWREAELRWISGSPNLHIRKV